MRPAARVFRLVVVPRVKISSEESAAGEGPAGGLVGDRCFLGEPVGAPVDVGVVVLGELVHCLQHLARLLGARPGVEECQLGPGSQEGEVGPDVAHHTLARNPS